MERCDLLKYCPRAHLGPYHCAPRADHSTNSSADSTLYHWLNDQAYAALSVHYLKAYIMIIFISITAFEVLGLLNSSFVRGAPTSFGKYF